MGRKKDKIINSFTKIIRRNFSPCRIFLFGSQVTRRATKYSDYDFLLVSSKFKQWEWEERAAKAYHYKRNIPAAMDIICLTPKEFEKKKKEMGVIQEVAREGIEL